MKCELCDRVIRPGDVAHGIRYGTAGNEVFLPAQDSALTVICGPCGERVHRLVYQSLNPTSRKLTYPTIMNLYSDLTTIMKNGYRMIQALGQLSPAEQTAIQHLIITCKQAK